MDEMFAIGFYVPSTYVPADEDWQDLLDCLEYAAPQVVTKDD